MNLLTLIGLSAAFFTTASLIPQVIQILRSGNVEGISIAMYSTFTLGVALWLTYGALLNDLPIMLANATTLALAGLVLFLVIKQRLVTKSEDNKINR